MWWQLCVECAKTSTIHYTKLRFYFVPYIKLKPHHHNHCFTAHTTLKHGHNIIYIITRGWSNSQFQYVYSMWLPSEINWIAWSKSSCVMWESAPCNNANFFASMHISCMSFPEKLWGHVEMLTFTPVDNCMSSNLHQQISEAIPSWLIDPHTWCKW